MLTVESGTHWALHRDFVGKRLASLAADEALELGELTDSSVSEFVSRGSQWDNDQLKVLTVDAAGLMRSSMAARFKALLHIYRQTGQVVGSRPNFFLNQYDPGGATDMHRDDQSPATLAVTLTGAARVHLQDPSNDNWQTFRLRPTDALYLDNDWPEEGRPLHQVENSDKPRIAFVTGSILLPPPIY